MKLETIPLYGVHGSSCVPIATDIIYFHSAQKRKSGWPANVALAAILLTVTVLSTCSLFCGDSSDGNDGNLKLIDFDQTLPDTTFARDGGNLEVMYDPTINNSQMGLMTFPASAEGSNPKCSFVSYYRGKLGNTMTGFSTYVPGTPSYEWVTPYVVFAVTVDDSFEEYAWVVGRRVAGWEIIPLPLDECPVDTWLECVMDADTLVHVAGFRENLGDNFVTWNYGKLADLVNAPLSGGRTWGDLDIVHIEICAGVRGDGPPFMAYVDDIIICPNPVQ